MKVRTIDYVEIDVGDNGFESGKEPELIALRSEQVFACLRGPTVHRAVAIASLNDAQFAKMFGSSGKSPRYRNGQRLRSAGKIIVDDTVIEKLKTANASVDALVEVSKYRDPEAQLAAFVRFQIKTATSRSRRC